MTFLRKLPDFGHLFGPGPNERVVPCACVHGEYPPHTPPTPRHHLGLAQTPGRNHRFYGFFMDFMQK